MYTNVQHSQAIYNEKIDRYTSSICADRYRSYFNISYLKKKNVQPTQRKLVVDAIVFNDTLFILLLKIYSTLLCVALKILFFSDRSFCHLVSIYRICHIQTDKLTFNADMQFYQQIQ